MDSAVGAAYITLERLHNNGNSHFLVCIKAFRRYSDEKTLSYGMVGGDLHAFIGGVHRIAINFGWAAHFKGRLPLAKNEDKTGNVESFII